MIPVQLASFAMARAKRLLVPGDTRRYTVGVQLGARTIAALDILAAHYGMSRSAMAAYLIERGIQTELAKLSTTVAPLAKKPAE